jgi:hypothetical protein
MCGESVCVWVGACVRACDGHGVCCAWTGCIWKDLPGTIVSFDAMAARACIAFVAVVLAGSTCAAESDDVKRALAEKVHAFTSIEQETVLFETWRSMVVPDGTQMSPESNARIRKILQPAIDKVTMKTKHAVVNIWSQQMNTMELRAMLAWYSTKTARKLAKLNGIIQKEKAAVIQDTEIQAVLEQVFADFDAIKDEL